MSSSREKKVILVTGGTGMIGWAIRKTVEEAKRNGDPQIANETFIFVSSKDADLRNREQTVQLFKKHQPTHVIHLAALVGGLFDNMSRNFDYLDYNLQMNLNVLHASYITNVKKVVATISTCVFPDKVPSFPMTEEMLHAGPPHSSNYGFTYGKRIVDIYNRAYRDQFGCNFTSVIPCNVCGPNDNYDLKCSHVVAAIIRKMYDAKERGDEKYVVYGSGKPLRQFLFSLDLAKLYLWALREYNDVDPILVAVDESAEVSIAHLAKTVKEALGFKGELIFDATKPDGQYKKTASNKKLRSYLPDFQFTKFEDAIKQSVDWYVQNRDVARN